MSGFAVVQRVCKLFDKTYAPMGCYWSDRPDRRSFGLHIYANHSDRDPINVVEFQYDELEVTDEFIERVFLTHVQARITG